MVFTATNLPEAPAGRVYQVWVVTAAGPVSAGLLTRDAGGRAEAYFNTPPDIAPARRRLPSPSNPPAECPPDG